jgi:hypothetical protein
MRPDGCGCLLPGSRTLDSGPLLQASQSVPLEMLMIRGCAERHKAAVASRLWDHLFFRSLPNRIRKDAMVTIENIRNWVQTFAVLAGSLSLVIATIAYLLSRKGLQFNVMIACIQRFQDLLPSLDSDDVAERDVLQYMDLCNEELFYFQKRYLRKEVALEWIEGMTKFLPLLNDTTGSPWDDQSFITASDKLIHQFPRVEYAFSSPVFPEIATKEARRRHVERILKRAQQYRY